MLTNAVGIAVTLEDNENWDPDADNSRMYVAKLWFGPVCMFEMETYKSNEWEMIEVTVEILTEFRKRLEK